MVKWTTSVKQRVYAQKKIYLIDTGLKTLVSGRGDLGFKAENAVYVQLQRKEKETGYFAVSKKEVNFIVGGHTDPEPVEVKYVEKLDKDDKRLSGLRLFLKNHPEAKNPVVVTKSAEGSLPLDDTSVNFVPLWQYLLNK
jgi:hypothetical protein